MLTRPPFMSAVPLAEPLAGAPPRDELVAALGWDHVEVPVEVDRPWTIAGAAADDARVLELPAWCELDEFGRQTQPVHRVAQRGPARAESAARRVLRVHGHELLQQRGHPVGTRPEPGLHLIGPIHHGLPPCS